MVEIITATIINARWKRSWWSFISYAFPWNSCHWKEGTYDSLLSSCFAAYTCQFFVLCLGRNRIGPADVSMHHHCGRHCHIQRCCSVAVLRDIHKVVHNWFLTVTQTSPFISRHQCDGKFKWIIYYRPWMQKNNQEKIILIIKLHSTCLAWSTISMPTSGILAVSKYTFNS